MQQTCAEIVKNLNEHDYDKKNYVIHQINTWEWHIDMLWDVPGAYTIVRDGKDLAILQNSTHEFDPIPKFDTMLPLSSCTWEDLWNFIDAGLALESYTLERISEVPTPN